MKKANLHSLDWMEQMMVRWICGVSLKDRKRSVDLYVEEMDVFKINDDDDYDNSRVSVWNNLRRIYD